MGFDMFLTMLLISYLFGSIPFGVLLGRIFKKKDIRDEGSGNSGTANAFRSLGFFGGCLTFILDVAKGYIPMCCADRLHFQPWEIIVIGIIAITGHMYSFILKLVDLKDKKLRNIGGKGVATLCGIIIYIKLEIAGIGLLVWALTILISRYSSLGSLIAVWFSFSLGIYLKINTYYLAFLLLAAILITYNHRKNIVNLYLGKELKISEKNQIK